jgi:sirohydrochlorin ferrochelatase
MDRESELQGLSMSYRAKRVVVRTSLLALGVAFEMVSKHSTELKNEIADWEDGRIFSLGVLPDGPVISLRKQGNRIRYLGRGQEDAEIKFLFKNIDSALLLTTSKMGAHTAFAQHRSVVHGNIAKAVEVSRAMSIVQSFVVPGFVLKRTSKRPPKLTPAQLLLKARVMATLAIGILINIGR